jgi:hypothetical protein
MFHLLRLGRPQKSARRSALIAFAALLGGAAFAPLYAHHPTPASSGDARLDKPEDQLIFGLEWLRGEPQNRETLAASLYGELAFLENRLGLSLRLPYNYYMQRNRDDAGRYGRPRLGLRGALYSGESLALLADADFAPATGGDARSFVDENFAESAGGLTLGLSFEHWRFVVRGGGRWPLSRLPEPSATPTVTTETFARPRETPANRSTHALIPVTEWQARVVYMARDDLALFAGGLYRLPYEGPLVEKARSIYAPGIFREAEAGASFSFTDYAFVSLSYRYPLYRKREIGTGETLAALLASRALANPREFRLYAESWQLQLGLRF